MYYCLYLISNVNTTNNMLMYYTYAHNNIAVDEIRHLRLTLLAMCEVFNFGNPFGFPNLMHCNIKENQSLANAYISVVCQVLSTRSCALEFLFKHHSEDQCYP